MIGSRGQQWAVMKLLQGGVLAIIMLAIVYGVINSVKEHSPRSDVYTITCDVLGSAYAARGTGQFFVREALLVEQEIDSEALIQCSGIPRESVVKMICQKAFCLKDGESLDDRSDCRLHSPCSSIEFVAGQTIDVCASCDNSDECIVWFGESAC